MRAVIFRRANTLVELLIAVAIIAALMALLLPAIQATRESARLVHCRNNLKNIGTGLVLYHDAHRQFPDGGWGHFWVGVPERGNGKSQPGGWIYSLLPYVEEGNLHDLGSGATGEEATEQYSRRVQSPIPLFVCSTRRLCKAWPIAESYSHAKAPKPFGSVLAVARTDFAINAGTAHVFGIGGPVDLQQGDDPNYWRTGPSTPNFSGISHLRRGASLKTVVDGASKTYLAGEKHVPAGSYMDGSSPGDNASLYAGYCSDLHRFTGVIENLKVGKPPYASALSDGARAENVPPESVRFGSAHPAGFNMVFCDGSVAFVDFDVDAEIHFRSGNRQDQGSPLESLN